VHGHGDAHRPRRLRLARARRHGQGRQARHHAGRLRRQRLRLRRDGTHRRLARQRALHGTSPKSRRRTASSRRPPSATSTATASPSCSSAPTRSSAQGGSPAPSTSSTAAAQRARRRGAPQLAHHDDLVRALPAGRRGRPQLGRRRHVRRGQLAAVDARQRDARRSSSRSIPGTQAKLNATPTRTRSRPPGPERPEGQTARGVDPPATSVRSPRRPSPTPCSRSSRSRLSATSIRTASPDVVASAARSTWPSTSSRPGRHQPEVRQPGRGVERQDGRDAPGSPFVLEDFTFFNSQAIADLNGDDYPEVLTGSGGYFLHAFDGCGREPEGGPSSPDSGSSSTPADRRRRRRRQARGGHGHARGWLYAWHTERQE
jgi:hypothetical protein